MELTDYQIECLKISIGQAYNDQKTIKKYGSANGLIDHIIDVIEEIVSLPQACPCLCHKLVKNEITIIGNKEFRI